MSKMFDSERMWKLSNDTKREIATVSLSGSFEFYPSVKWMGKFDHIPHHKYETKF